MTVTIAHPPWSSSGRRIEAQIRKALYDYRMLDKSNKIAIALSGGKDSLTLLFMLAAISGRGFPKLELHAIHIAGAFTCGAGVHASYLEKVCKELAVSFTLRTSEQKLQTLECYSCSRKRRSLLFEAALEAGASTIAFGHHRDDNAQTVLLNLCQKGSFEGMLPKLEMHAYGVKIIRPLTYVSEQDIRTFAKQNGFMRILCRCPVGQHSMRRKAEELLSELEETFPFVRERIAKAALRHGTRKAEKPAMRYTGCENEEK